MRTEAQRSGASSPDNCNPSERDLHPPPVTATPAPSPTPSPTAAPSPTPAPPLRNARRGILDVSGAPKWSWGFIAPDRLFDLPISSRAKLTYLAITRRAPRSDPKPGKEHPFPSWSDLVRLTSLSRRSIARAISELEEADLLRRSKRYDARGQTSSAYYLKHLAPEHPEKPESAPVAPEGAGECQGGTPPRARVARQEEIHGEEKTHPSGVPARQTPDPISSPEVKARIELRDRYRDFFRKTWGRPYEGNQKADWSVLGVLLRRARAVDEKQPIGEVSRRLGNLLSSPYWGDGRVVTLGDLSRNWDKAAESMDFKPKNGRA